MAQGAAGESEDQRGQNGTILLVEDNPAYIRLVRELLREAGLESFDLEWADLLEKGLDRLEAGDVDLILLDLLLPDNMGTNTLEVVLDQSPDTPVVVLTGIDDDELASDALDMGAVDYLCKGRLDADRLARAVRYGLDSGREQAESTREPGVVGIERLIPAVAGQLDQAAGRLEEASEHLDPLADPEATERIELDRDRCRIAADALREIVDLASDPRQQARVSLHQAIDEALIRLSSDGSIAGRVKLDWSAAPKVAGDPESLVRLFELLIAHLLDPERSEPGELHVDAVLDGDDWEIQLRDTGLLDGTNPLETLFSTETEGERLEGPLARTLCEAIVSSHGGRMWVEPDEQRGEGGCLCMTVPAARANIEPDATDAETGLRRRRR